MIDATVLVYEIDLWFICSGIFLVPIWCEHHNPTTNSDRSTIGRSARLHAGVDSFTRTPRRRILVKWRLDLIKETEMFFGTFEGKDVRSGSFTGEHF